MQVCLVALNAYPAIDPQVPGPIGGIETRSWMLARGLATRPEMQVQFVIRHHASARQPVDDGVELITLVDPLYPHWQKLGHSLERRGGFPWVRVKRFDPRLLWLIPRLALDRLIRGRVYAADSPDQRLIDLSPDVYATFGVQTHSAVVIRSAHAAGRSAVLFLGSDGDLDPLFEPGGIGVDPYGTRADVGRFILQSADLIIAQTPDQQLRLKSAFGLESRLLPNPIDVGAWDAGRSLPLDSQYATGLDRYVLWVGRAEEVHKRPQVCLTIAEACPDVKFLLVMNPRDSVVESRIRAAAPPNVRIVDRVPFPQMPALFAKAAAFLSTSRLEGFPNVFLQAAASGTPIVSLEVGNEFLRTARAGVCTHGNRAAAAETVTRIWNRQPLTEVDFASARAFVLEHHDLPTQIDRLLVWLRSAALSHGRPIRGGDAAG